jgi:tetratricopeptide (TPR) repeat protein
MHNARFPLLFALLFVSLTAWTQSTKIVIPAGSPEDKELAAIAGESDLQKRIGRYEEFNQKYADNRPALAYGEWQLAQQYSAAAENIKALEAGDKALELYPTDLDIIVSQAGVAQALKDNGKVVEYAVRGATVFNSIAKQAKPGDVPDAQWTTEIGQQEAAAKPGYDFLETAAYNAIASEQDANKRMAYIEKFTPAFPKSQFDQQISQLALYSLQQLNQPQRLEAYGEKALAANPDSLPTLLMMANAYAEDAKQSAKAVPYASKVITLVGPNPSTVDKARKLSAGVAHSTLGYVYLTQDKLTPAVTELRTAVALLPEDPQAQQAALFRLGYAYAKENRKSEAVASLQKAIAIDGPFQRPAKELLAKISAAGK